MNKFMQFIRITLLSIFVLLVASCEVGVDDLQRSDTADKVSVDSHLNNAIVKSSPIVISGQVDINNATVTVNGVEAEVNDGLFLVSVALNEGVNSIDVVAQNDSERSVANLEVALNTTQMCGTGETFTVQLPGLSLPGDISTRNLPDRRLPADSVTLPKGCSIYAIFVHGYGRNVDLNELMFYNLAKFVADNKGYVHWSWWNNFLGEYMARPLHGSANIEPDPGNVIANALAFTIPKGLGKAIPDEDYQFQADAKRVLAAIKRENPNAIIIVAGHSMGGNAVARLGRDTSVEIDLLAPIDPVGNRNIPVGVGTATDYNTKIRSATPGTLFYTPGNETYNWTRWRATRQFRGYKQRDCVRNSLGLCKDFDKRPFRVDYHCTTTPGWLIVPPVPILFSKAPLICPRFEWQGPVRDSGIRTSFRSNIKRLYHRWQQEATFPYDYHADDPDHRILGIPSPIKANYTFGHPGKRSRSILGSNYQEPVVENVPGENNRDKTCRDNDDLDPRGATGLLIGNELSCRQWDGHGEIIGMRAIAGIPFPINANLQALALTAQPNNWQDISESVRRDRLISMGDEDTWKHAPVQPNLDLVVNDMVLIAQDILDRGEPGGEDVTPPSSFATLSVVPNAFGWNNTDINVTLSAIDEAGGSGVKEIIFTMTGANSGDGVHEGSSLQLILTVEGTTTIEYYARDDSGNLEEINTLVVKIDKTPPVVELTVDSEANEHGWNNSDVTVTFTAEDTLSGVDTVTDPVTVTDEGADQEVIGVAVDKAGNTTTIGVILNIDKTPPEIVGLPENCSIWAPDHKMVKVSDVIAIDALSGIDTVTANGVSSEPESGLGYGNTVPDIIINDEGIELRAERYSLSGRTYDLTAAAVDLAGNVAEGDSSCIVEHDQGSVNN